MNKPRYFYKDSYHHLYNRGVNKNKIYFEKEDYFFFLRRIKKYKELYSIDILCYCLMPNHFHLFVKQLTNEKTIGDFISALINSYTKSLNKKHNRSGVLFEGRTKNKIIKKESYFKWVCKYILKNPIEAKLVKNIADWEFSSARDYFGLREGTLVNKHEVLSHFDSIESFKSFIEEKNKEVVYNF
ncbi:transposase IS200 like protein [bacterium BMS3Abin04]|nr:transposase IS200 like protein [bacterium BMS3Abin04]